MALIDDVIAIWHNNGDGLDSSGNDHTIVYTGGSFNTVDQKLGSACTDLDGIDDFGTVADADDLDGFTSGMSLSMWVKRDNIDAFTYLLTKWITSGNQRSWWCTFNASNQIVFQVSSNGTETGSTVDIATTINSFTSTSDFYHLVFVWESGQRLKVYVDNVDESTTTAGIPQSSVHTGTSDIIMGRHPTASVVFFPGLMDEVVLWNRDLSVAEVAELWNGGTGIEVGVFTPQIIML